jgi:hypothetical protein
MNNPFTGPEWEGWRPMNPPMYMNYGAERNSAEVHIEVQEIKGRHYVEVAVDSPESALRIANVIAEETGGWA